jgi:uncharacterized protein
MTFSFLVISLSAQAQIATLDGNWHSPQWKYGYVLKDGMGIATSTNSPNFQVGQNIIQLTATSPNAFTGQQVYTDGKFYKVTATLLPDGRLSFVGEKNVKWVMERIGAPPQASSPASQTTTSAPSAAGNSPSFDCGKVTTMVEKLICTNPELSKLDVSLAETYKEAVSKDRSIRDDQRAWNVEKNKCSDVDCLKTTYEDRISELTNFIVRYDRAALNQGQAQAPTPAPTNVSPAPPLASPNQPAQRYANMDQFIAPEICAEYADNPIAAEKQFKGKLVKIYGPIERIAVDAFGTPFLLISGKPVRCSVRLNFPKNKVSSLEVLRRGDFITAVCKTSNKILSEIVTDECQLL